MRFVRSAAASRNRRRPRLAWFFLAILALVLALTARIAGAAPIASAGDVEADIRVSGDPVAGVDEIVIDELAIDELDSDELEDLLDRAELNAEDESFEDESGAIDDAEVDAIETGELDASAFDASAFNASGAGANEARDAVLHGRRSAIGRVDVSLIYRHVDPMISATRDEVWLLGTWRP